MDRKRDDIARSESVESLAGNDSCKDSSTTKSSLANNIYVVQIPTPEEQSYWDRNNREEEGDVHGDSEWGVHQD
jgi:hypothetical protein